MYYYTVLVCNSMIYFNHHMHHDVSCHHTKYKTSCCCGTLLAMYIRVYTLIFIYNINNNDKT